HHSLPKWRLQLSRVLRKRPSENHDECYSFSRSELRQKALRRRLPCEVSELSRANRCNHHVSKGALTLFDNQADRSFWSPTRDLESRPIYLVRKHEARKRNVMSIQLFAVHRRIIEVNQSITVANCNSEQFWRGFNSQIPPRS